MLFIVVSSVMQPFFLVLGRLGPPAELLLRHHFSSQSDIRQQLTSITNTQHYGNFGFLTAHALIITVFTPFSYTVMFSGISE
jgi:hypothetical protein